MSGGQSGRGDRGSEAVETVQGRGEEVMAVDGLDA